MKFGVLHDLLCYKTMATPVSLGSRICFFLVEFHRTYNRLNQHCETRHISFTLSKQNGFNFFDKHRSETLRQSRQSQLPIFFFFGWIKKGIAFKLIFISLCWRLDVSNLKSLVGTNNVTLRTTGL